MIILLHILLDNQFEITLDLWSAFNHKRGHHGRDRMIVGFTTTYAISTYHHYSTDHMIVEITTTYAISAYHH